MSVLDLIWNSYMKANLSLLQLADSDKFAEAYPDLIFKVWLGAE